MNPAAIALALHLLGLSPDAARVVPVTERPASLDAQHARAVQGWVNEDSDAVFIPTWSPVYRDAEKGKAIELAGVIAHELCHVAQPRSNDRPETPCYDVQIATLKRLHASRRAIADVQETRDRFALSERLTRKDAR